MSSGDQLARMVHPEEVRAVSFSPDGNLIATGSKTVDHYTAVWLWSAEGKTESAPMKVPGSRADQLVFSEDGRHVAGRWSSYVYSMDISKGLVASNPPEFKSSWDKAVSPRYITAWDREHGSLRLWETAGARELAPFSVDQTGRLVFDSTGTALAGTRSTDNHGNGVVEVYALPEWRRLGPPVPIGSGDEFALSPEGRYVAVEVSEPGEQRFQYKYYVDVWDVAASHRITRLSQAQEVTKIAFHPKGTTLFTIAQPDEVQVWELPEGKLRSRLKHEREIQALRFSNEDSFIATISEGRVYIWDSSTGMILSQVSDAGYVRDVRFSPNGRSLLTGSDDGTAIAWLWKTEDMQAEACKRLVRNLTVDEWRQYLGDEPYRKTCPNLP
jgi:WD40 repeat protein